MGLARSTATRTPRKCSAKLKKDDETLEGELETLKNAIDAHHKDNRDKRKALQERRNGLAK
jgi:hypothetical protein